MSFLRGLLQVSGLLFLLYSFVGMYKNFYIFIPGWYDFAFNVEFDLWRGAICLMFVAFIVSIFGELIVGNFYLNLLIYFPYFFQTILTIGNPSYFEFWLFSSLIIISIVKIQRILSKYTLISNKMFVLNANFASWFFVLLTFVVGLLIYVFNGRLFSLDFELIYDLREDIYTNLPIIFVFLFFMVTKVIIPILIVLFLRIKSQLGFFATMLLSVMYFGLTQQKAILFYPFVVIVIYFFGHHLSNFFRFTFIIAGLVFIAFLFPDDFRYFYEYGLVRRTFFIPAWTNLLYYDFFQNNDFLFWRDSKISFGLFANPYSESIPYLIGDSIGAINGHVNTGWIGSGYMHAGYLGILIYGIIIAGTISFFNRISTLSDGFFNKNMIYAITFPGYFWLIMSSDLPSIFLTHGLLYIILFFLFFKFRYEQA